MRSTRLPVLVAVLPVVLACAGCSAESRMWRLSPFSGSGEKSSDRSNLWPIAYSSPSGSSVLWPLIDFDSRGFAIRPLVSRNDSDLDILFPLSHFDTDSGDGWALTAYKYHDDAGLFPLCNFGPSFNYFLPAFWNRQGGAVTSYGLFPVAAVTHDFGYVGPAWWTGGNTGKDFGLFPLFTWGDLKWIGPAWWYDDGRDATADATDAKVAGGLFPLVWKWDDPTRLLVLPLYYGDPDRSLLFPLYYGKHAAGDDFHALLVPPTWWEDGRDGAAHVVLPFYLHFADAHEEVTAWLPFYASQTAAGRFRWFSPIGDGWDDGTSSGLDLYPLWYSAETHDEFRPTARQMLLPFYFYREAGDDRLLLTPLGGRGWDASGRSRFLNVLGPVYHHSESGSSETTAIAWPFFERDRTGDTTTTRSIPFFGSTATPAGRATWFAAGLGRCVATDAGSSFRFTPLYARSDAKEAPDLLWHLTLVGTASHDDAWSAHVFPLYFGSGDAKREQNDAWILGGLSRYVANGKESSFRIFPLYSQSNAATAPDPLFDLTLVGGSTHDDGTPGGGSWSRHFLPLYWGNGDGRSSSQTALLGLGRVGTTESGSAWRLWPLASGSSDPAAEGWIDQLSLFRHERTGTGGRDWLLPLYYSSRHDDDSDLELLPPLFHHGTTAKGSAWRLWPLVTDTDADGLEGWLDPFTLVASHERETKTHIHVGTDAIFGFDRFGPEKRSWNARLFTLCEFGHTERSDDAAAPDLQEQNLAADTGNGAIGRRPVTVARNHAGFLFDWFLVDRSVTLDHDGGHHDESHYRLPLLQEYRKTPEKSEWDLLCWAVHSKETKDEGTFSVLGYGYRSERNGDSVKRDIFPFMTWDTAPTTTEFHFLSRVFHYERQGEKSGGHVLFIPWGNTD